MLWLVPGLALTKSTINSGELTYKYPACIPPFTRGQVAVIRRIGGRCHFRSRDENGGQTIRSAISENPMPYVNFTAVSSIDSELLPIEVLHCRNSEFRVFLRKIVEKY